MTAPPTFSPTPERGKGASNNLEVDLTVTATVAAGPCTGLTIRIIQQSGPTTISADSYTYSASPARYSTSFSKNGFTWSVGQYTAEVLVNGAVQTSISFTLS
ncbi:MAG: hypothetical protein ACSLFO_11250 [Acidimicrobiales bacterium]